MRKSVFILSIHALCAIVLLAAQVLLAEVSATFTATVGSESVFPIALQGDSVEFWLEDMEIEVTGLPDNEYCIANVENINYSWQVNENVYGSGSQATVNSAAPGGTPTGHDTLETLGVHKIAFSGAGNVDVFYEVNAGLVHLEVPVCLYAEANFGIAKLILVTPHGDPINNAYPATGPYDGVPTCNEFSFDKSRPNGVLGIRLMAEVQPLEIRQYFNVGDVSFTIDSVGNAAPSYSASRWSPEPDVVWRRYILCDATIIGLPASNSDFGLKTARMYYKGSLVAENNYEVFYDREATNHPYCSTCSNCENWYYYWKQAFMEKYPSIVPNMRYAGPETHENLDWANGITPAMLDWIYDTPQSNNEDRMDKTLILIGINAYGEKTNLQYNETLTGIDTFFSTIFHELKHVDQISRADDYLWSYNGVPSGTNGADSFRYGWSWNTSETRHGRPWQPHNHWAIGGDGKWGKQNFDDDFDNDFDNAAPVPKVINNIGILELGQGGDDICLENTSVPNSDWPKGWEIYDFSPYNGRDNHNMPLYGFAEREAIKAADDNVRQNENARFDWGAPGKNHGTINNYND